MKTFSIILSCIFTYVVVAGYLGTKREKKELLQKKEEFESGLKHARTLAEEHRYAEMEKVYLDKIIPFHSDKFLELANLYQFHNQIPDAIRVLEHGLIYSNDRNAVHKACYELVKIYQNQNLPFYNLQRAFEIERLCRSDEYGLGLMYFYGIGCERNYEKAAEVFLPGMKIAAFWMSFPQRPARLGLMHLAFLFHHGLGVAKDEAQAYRALRVYCNESMRDQFIDVDHKRITADELKTAISAELSPELLAQLDEEIDKQLAKETHEYWCMHK